MSATDSGSFISETFSSSCSLSPERSIIPVQFKPLQIDPALALTPEKPKVTKKTAIVKSKLSHVIEPDPTLLVTPEKHCISISGTKSHNSQSNTNDTKKGVRFELPESGSGADMSSTISTKYDSLTDISSQFSSSNDEPVKPNVRKSATTGSDFSERAALFTVRNPLGDITANTSQTFDSSNNSTAGFTSSFSDKPSFDSTLLGKSFQSILNMEGKRVVDSSLHKVEAKPCVVGTSFPTAPQVVISNKSGVAKSKINKLTNPRKDQVKNSAPPHGKFLKKKSGLQKHNHSVVQFQSNENDPTCFEKPKYHTSLAAGQHLQALKEEKFDATAAISQKMSQDKQFVTQVGKVASNATNFTKDASLYGNLISLDPSPTDFSCIHEYKSVRRPMPPKKNYTMFTQDIMNMFPDDLIQERCFIESKCYKIPDLLSLSKLSDVNSAMSMYQHSVWWDK